MELVVVHCCTYCIIINMPWDPWRVVSDLLAETACDASIWARGVTTLSSGRIIEPYIQHIRIS